jgi:hypothetical protein
MRRSFAALVVALSTALAVTSAATSSSSAAPMASGSVAGPALREARSALHAAQRVLSTTTDARPTDPTMTLLHLRLTMNDLSGRERRQASSILARPTNDPDFFGQTYAVPAKRKCRGHICLHWVPTTRDAPPSRHWVDRMLTMMNDVWRYEVDRLGYRRPLPDGQRGGNGRFDVYLKELYHQGLYGLTTAERPTSYNQDLYSGYLLLDNDFKRSQYHGKPMQVARVTAAHEFFHAIQFGYDVREDAWLMEATSTWMEDQYDTRSNDNRQYLPYGQLGAADQPLDTFQASGFAQYGNWPFFESIGQRFGRAVVRKIWHRAGAFAGGGHEFSAHAIRHVLNHQGRFDKVFAKYAAGNLTPSRAYPEGRDYPSPGFVAKWPLTRAAPTVTSTTFRVHHLASGSIKVIPGDNLDKRTWRLHLRVSGPGRHKHPVVYVVVRTRHHGRVSELMHLDRRGHGFVSLPFSHRSVKFVTMTLVNASTAFQQCGQGTYSCSGVPRAANPAFAVKAVAVKP